MSTGAGETSANPLKQLLERITRHCNKIAFARKEASGLADLCTSLGNRINDRSFTVPQQSNQDDLRRELAEIEKRMEEWSKYNSIKGLIKKKDVEAGITGFVERLESLRLANQPDRRGTGGTITREGTRDDRSSIATITGYSSSETLLRQVAEPETSEGNAFENSQSHTIRPLNGEITRQGEIAFSGGLHCEVWVGFWERGRKERGGREGAGKEKAEVEKVKVALKVLRLLKSPEKARESLECELPKWAELHHQNILPFYGIITDIEPRIYMVFPWQENGNLLDYVRKHPEADKNYLLRGSAAGLSCLHSRGLVHGSVRCNNVLISQEGEPQICDFGIAKIVEDGNENTISKTISSGAAVRYAAPELIENNNFSATTHSDTYSFALLIVECITEEEPFSNIIRDAAVIHARITKRQCPPRPNGQHSRNRVSDHLWDLMNRCWSDSPSKRPTMEHVHHFFLDQA